MCGALLEECALSYLICQPLEKWIIIYFIYL
jgi:hypothetical protein